MADVDEIDTEQLENHMNIVQNNLLSLEKCLEKKLEKINELKEQITSREVECTEKDEKLEVLEKEHTKLEQEHKNLVEEL